MYNYISFCSKSVDLIEKSSVPGLDISYQYKAHQVHDWQFLPGVQYNSGCKIRCYESPCQTLAECLAAWVPIVIVLAVCQSQYDEKAVGRELRICLYEYQVRHSPFPQIPLPPALLDPSVLTTLLDRNKGFALPTVDLRAQP